MENIIQRLYIYNNSDIPVYLEDLKILILPDNFINMYDYVENEYEIKNSLDLQYALNNDFLTTVSSSDFSTSTLDLSDDLWTSQYSQMFSISANSYAVLEPIETAAKLSKRTCQYYINSVYLSGGKT